MPAHLSQSQAQNLLGEYCSASYWYSRVLGKPEVPGWAMIGGSALHTASEVWDLALIDEGETDDSPARLRELFAAAFEDQIAKTEASSPYPSEEWQVSGRLIKSGNTKDGGPNKKDRAWWLEVGPEMLRLWTAWRLTSGWEIAWLRDEDDNPVAGVEVPFSVELGGAPVIGYIDRVFQRGDEFLVLDLKSGREPDSTAQLGTYAEGLLLNYGVRPRWGCYWLGGTGLSSSLVDLDVKWPSPRVHYRYAQARAAQLRGAFNHKPSNLCGSCGVRRYCPEFGGDLAASVPQPWDEGVEIRVREVSEQNRLRSA